ncbi:MAG: hypothetical protein ACOY99_01930 [Pseudomonadota bacterium]
MTWLRQHLRLLLFAALVVLGAFQVGLMAHDAGHEATFDGCAVCKTAIQNWAPPVSIDGAPRPVLVFLAALPSRAARGIAVQAVRRPPGQAPPLMPLPV